jgi:hypothetical protein
MSDERTERIEGKGLDELLASLMDAEVGSPVHEQAKAALPVRIAEMQRDATRTALTWAKVSAVSTAAATLIAVVALLIAAL